jgi:hypothetical protein
MLALNPSLVNLCIRYEGMATLPGSVDRVTLNKQQEPQCQGTQTSSTEKVKKDADSWKGVKTVTT